MQARAPSHTRAPPHRGPALAPTDSPRLPRRAALAPSSRRARPALGLEPHSLIFFLVDGNGRRHHARLRPALEVRTVRNPGCRRRKTPPHAASARAECEPPAAAVVGFGRRHRTRLRSVRSANRPRPRPLDTEDATTRGLGQCGVRTVHDPGCQIGRRHRARPRPVWRANRTRPRPPASAARPRAEHAL